MLYFEEEEVVRTTVEFGGTYVWGYDGATYDVGTAVMSMHFYTAQYAEGIPASELSYDTGSWMTATYYYSSCYADWDGYAVTHDPVFVAYPAQRPGDVSVPDQRPHERFVGSGRDWGCCDRCSLCKNEPRQKVSLGEARRLLPPFSLDCKHRLRSFSVPCIGENQGLAP